LKRVLLIEPPGGFIRLDRCMQSINSWGGVFRFPLNLSRIASHLISLGNDVRFLDLQADANCSLETVLLEFKPDLCILSCGFPSMRYDSTCAKSIKQVLPLSHVSTFGVAPTLLRENFFNSQEWGFEIFFDSVILGGEPALGYENLLLGDLSKSDQIIFTELSKSKFIDGRIGRQLFEHSLYKSPFTGRTATIIEGSYGCPHTCSFCVVPELYGNRFSKRKISDIIDEIIFVVENNGVEEITLWDEGTTFQKKFLLQFCDHLIFLRNTHPKFKNFSWSTRSTSSLLTEDLVQKLKQSGLSGITLGIESFDDSVLSKIDKGINEKTNKYAIDLLAKYRIISIGHIILGHVNDSASSIEYTIEQAIDSNLNFAQFYCLVPYPGTVLHKTAKSLGLVEVEDLTKYELCNPIMHTLNGITPTEIGIYREQATRKFWTEHRWRKLDNLIGNTYFTDVSKREQFMKWKGVINTTAKIELI